MKYHTCSPEETEAVAERFAASVRDGDCIAMFGGLGAGKTAFVRGLARGLGLDAEVSSPTFALVHEHHGVHHLYHFDMYRVEGFDALYSTGFFDLLGTDAILAIEWSENIVDELPPNRIEVRMTPGPGTDERDIEITRLGGEDE